MDLSELERLEQAAAPKTKKISELILDGCKGTYKVAFRLTDGEGGYCLIGALLRASGVSNAQIGMDPVHVTSLLNEYVPDYRAAESAYYRAYRQTPVTSNDETDLTREQIAARFAELGY